MRANLTDELLNAINERIYIDLELHTLQNRMNKSDNEGFKQYVDGLISNLIKQRKQVNDYLIQNGIKIYDVEKLDEMFVRYKYHQRLHGGFKEGYNQYWIDAMKLELKRRMAKYFGGE